MRGWHLSAVSGAERAGILAVISSIIYESALYWSRFAGEVVLVTGGDDQVWPSAESATRISARRAAVSLDTVVVTDARSGHPVVLPGEAAPNLDRPYRVGGDLGAPQRLGAKAWPAICSALKITAGA